MPILKTITQFPPVIAAAFALALVTHCGAQNVMTQEAARVKPYQITYHTRVVEDNQPIHEADSFKAQASNGDGIEESGMFWNAGETPSATRIRSLLIRSRGLSVETNTKNPYITTYGSGVPAPKVGNMGPSCEAYEGEITKESKTILGYRTLKLVGKTNTQEDPTTGDGVAIVVTESWLAPDLDCEPLLEITVRFHNDRAAGTSTKTATKANQDELPASAFEIAAGSIEVPPSVFKPSLDTGFSQKNEDAYNRQKARREAR